MWEPRERPIEFLASESTNLLDYLLELLHVKSAGHWVAGNQETHDRHQAIIQSTDEITSQR